MKKFLIFAFAILLANFSLFGQIIEIKEKPKKLGATINSSSEEIKPLLGKNGTLYFVRTFHEQNDGGKQGGQDIWLSYRESDASSWGEPTNLKSLNNIYNNAVVGIGKNDSSLYLLNTYSNPLRWRFGISASNKTAEGWSTPEELPISFNSKGDLRGYYISPGEDVILVSSENKDTYGREDIYLYYKTEKEKWKGPIHLNENINTELSEISPFITADHQVIFFASEGHDGLGSFDIYSSQRLDESWENWSPAKNLGNEINTDDFNGYFSTYEDGLTFFVTNKPGGSTDIYTTKVNIALINENKDLLASYEELKKLIDAAITAESAITERITQSDQNANEVKDLTTSSLDLNTKLGSLNDLHLALNQNVIGGAESGNPTSTSNENTTLFNDITGLDNSMSTLSQKSVSSNSEDSLALFYSQTAKLKREIAALIAENAALEVLLDSTNFATSDATASALETIESNNQSLREKIAEWTNMMRLFNADDYVRPEPTIAGYTVQLLAMTDGRDPVASYLQKVNANDIRKSKGKDGLDRYYIGNYDNIEDAIQEMKAYRSMGYSDAFVRAIIKYDELSSEGPSSYRANGSFSSTPNATEGTRSEPSQISNLNGRVEIDGYTVQLLAMTDGTEPLQSYLREVNIEEIQKSKGRDGLDRYYIGKYDNKKEALQVMRSLRSKGYSDVFVRALVKYDNL